MVFLPDEEAEISSDDARIATAALQLVGELGADRITIADVVRHLGISRAAMLRRCPTEADLWQITAAFITRQMFESFSTSLTGRLPPLERLRSLVAAHIDLIMGTPALRDILFSRRLRQNYTGLTRELLAARLQFQRLLARTVAQGMAVGDFPAARDPDDAARRIIEMLQGIVLRWSLAFEPDIALEDVWTRLDELLGRSTGAASANHEAPAPACREG